MALEPISELRTVVTRVEARAAGLPRYFTGKPCKNGHFDERYVSSFGCLACGVACAAEPERLTRSRIWGRVYAATKRAALKAAAEGGDEAAAAELENIRLKHNACDRRRRQANPKKHRAGVGAWQQANPGYVTKKVRQWRIANPAAAKIIRATQRAKTRSGDADFGASDIKEIISAQRGKCGYCRKKVGKSYHLDHIYALSRGGKNRRRNLQILCESCNLRKHAKDPVDFAQEMGLLV